MSGKLQASMPDLVASSDTGPSSVDNVTSDTTPAFVGSAEANAMVVLLDGANATTIGTTKADGTGAWSITVAVLAAGVHAITARATDAAGNVGEASSALSVTIDTTAPGAPSGLNLAALSDLGASNTDNITSVTTPWILGKAEAGATVTLIVGGVIVGTGKANSAGAWRVQTKALADGTHAITAKATDPAGNDSGVSTALSVTVDSKAPPAPVSLDLATDSDDGASNSDNITTVMTPRITGKAEANSRIALFDGKTEIASAHADGAGDWSVKTGQLAPGVHAITAKATDISGNISIASSSLSVTIVSADTVAPNAPSAPNLAYAYDSGQSSSDNITNLPSLRFTGRAEVGTRVTLFDGDVAVGSRSVGASGTWLIQSNARPDGVRVFTAKAMDPSGNVSVASAGLTVTLDTKAPPPPGAPDLAAESDNGASNTDNITSATVQRFTGKADPNAQLALFDGKTQIATSASDEAGDWSVNAKLSALGVHAITAKVIDVAGNLSIASPTLSVTIVSDDTSAPNAPSVPDLVASFDHGPSDSDNITNVPTVRFKGTAEAGTTVTLFDGDVLVGSGSAGTSGTWLIQSAARADGVHSFTAKATDLAGNVSLASAGLTVTIDTKTPAAPGAPDLSDASDDGVSNTDNITSVTLPVYTGQTEANATISLFDGATFVGVTQANGAGVWTAQAGLKGSGMHEITVRATDLAGNVNGASPALVVHFDPDPSVAARARGPMAATSAAPVADGGKDAAGPTIAGVGGTEADDGATIQASVLPTAGLTFIISATNPDGAAFAATPFPVAGADLDHQTDASGSVSMSIRTDPVPCPVPPQVEYADVPPASAFMVVGDPSPTPIPPIVLTLGQ